MGYRPGVDVKFTFDYKHDVHYGHLKAMKRNALSLIPDQLNGWFDYISDHGSSGKLEEYIELSMPPNTVSIHNALRIFLSILLCKFLPEYFMSADIIIHHGDEAEIDPFDESYDRSDDDECIHITSITEYFKRCHYSNDSDDWGRLMSDIKTILCPS